jgi:hypothetical protein
MLPLVIIDFILSPVALFHVESDSDRRHEGDLIQGQFVYVWFCFYPMDLCHARDARKY